MNNESKYMSQLDGLRFLAVLGVSWHHWAPSTMHFNLPWNAGVKLFFVLSGFLITGILLRCRVAVKSGQLSKGQSLKQFYIRRFLRIFPLYYFVLCAAAVLGLEMVRESFGWHLSYISNYYFLKIGYFDSYLSHFWTLAVEEQFYLFWPFIILFAAKRSLFWIILAGIAVGPIHRIIQGSDYLNSITYGLATLDCIDFLLMGALLALAVSKYLSNPMLEWLKKYHREIFKASVAVYGAIFFINTMGKNNFILASVEYSCMGIIFTYLIYKVSLGIGGVTGKLLNLKWVSYLGKISYGLYVYHLFAGPVVSWMYGVFSAEALIKNNFPLYLVSMSAWTVAVASLSWFLFERPINNLKRFFPYY